MDENLQKVAGNYYETEETEGKSHGELMEMLTEKFFSFEKYQGLKPQPNHDKCLGRGFLILNGGARLIPCTCLKQRVKDAKNEVA